MEAAKEVDEGSGSNNKKLMSFRDFMFQKTYAEEMIQCLYAFQFETCDACQVLGNDHTCDSMAILRYWNEAHFFSNQECIFRLNKRLEKFSEEPYTAMEFAKALTKVRNEWYDQICVMIYILDEKL